MNGLPPLDWEVPMRLQDIQDHLFADSRFGTIDQQGQDPYFNVHPAHNPCKREMMPYRDQAVNDYWALHPAYFSSLELFQDEPPEEGASYLRVEIELVGSGADTRKLHISFEGVQQLQVKFSGDTHN